MSIRVSADSVLSLDADWLIATVAEGDPLHNVLTKVDTAIGGSISRVIERGDFTGEAGELIQLPDAAGIAAARIVLVGLGKAQDLTVAKFDKATTTAIRAITGKADRTAAVVLNSSATGNINLLQQAQSWATASLVGGRGQAFHKTEPDRFPLRDMTLSVESESVVSDVKGACAKGRILGEAINLTRELVNRTPEEIYPESFAQRARQIADAHPHLHCDVWDEERLKDENMGSLLAVARGSVKPARMVIVEYLQGGANAPTIALVGKGVTFDSGGYSLKPTDGMLTMKCDMAGAATVLGTMQAIADLGLKVNVIGLMGLVENLVSGDAFKLGDVLKARNGVTIEVANTDAEGRLVLADVLSYAVDRDVDRIIDLATLTGACVVALGEDVVGTFTNNPQWESDVVEAARATGEQIWSLPMFDLYNELIKSDVADVKNTGGRWGGAITAAKFLEKFVAKKPWVHLDIAGPSFASANKPHREGGGTGVMVKTLVETLSRME